MVLSPICCLLLLFKCTLLQTHNTTLQYSLPNKITGYSTLHNLLYIINRQHLTLLYCFTVLVTLFLLETRFGCWKTTREKLQNMHTHKQTQLNILNNDYSGKINLPVLFTEITVLIIERFFCCSWQVRNAIAQRGLILVGWYHSHPSYQPDPSVQDIQNQLKYQSILQQENAPYGPCLGIIVCKYFRFGFVSQGYTLGDSRSRIPTLRGYL